MTFEYRILPRKWLWDSKVRYYQDKKQFDQQARRMPIETHRHEVREVGDWKPHTSE